MDLLDVANQLQSPKAYGIEKESSISVADLQEVLKNYLTILHQRLDSETRYRMTVDFSFLKMEIW